MPKTSYPLLKCHARGKPAARSLARLLVATTGALLMTGFMADTAVAQSRMYKCTDAKGKVYYTQTPPAECLGRDTEVLNTKSGSVLKRIEGQLTPEQQAKRDEEMKKKAEIDVAAKEERRKNTALLNTYASEKDIDEARARSLKENEQGIKETEKRIDNAVKRQKELDGEKEFYAKKTLPPKLQQDIRNNEIDMKNQQELLDVKKKQVSTINAKYDEDKRRYIELTKGIIKK